MSWFNKRGIDVNTLLKTRFWLDIARIVDTDSETQRRLTEYVYLAVADARIHETEKHIEESKKPPYRLNMGFINYLDSRLVMLKSYKEMARGNKHTD